MMSQILPLLFSALAAIGVSSLLGLPGPNEAFYSQAFHAWLVVLFFVLIRAANLFGGRPYRSGAEIARFVTGMFQVLLLLLGLILAGTTSSRLELLIERLTFATPLEGVAQPAALLSALVIGLVFFMLLRSLPVLLLRLRLKGIISALAARETLVLSGIWVVVFALTLVLGEYEITSGQIAFAELTSSSAQLIAFMTIAVAATLGYLLPRYWLTRPGPSPSGGLWIVLPKRDSVTDLNAMASDSSEEWPGLVDRILGRDHNGPVTLVSPANGVAQGEHLHLADRLGILESLFPKLEIEAQDWINALPPNDRWQGMIHRQVHPTSELMPMLVEHHLAHNDQVLFLISDESQLQDWQGRLPVDRTHVLYISETGQTFTAGERVAGYLAYSTDISSARQMDFSKLIERETETFAETVSQSPTRPQGIYLSYRRKDTPHFTARLHDHLRLALPDLKIQRDLEPIEPGLDFHAYIQTILEKCGVCLAIIGRDWISQTDADGNRFLDDPHDFVRMELATALASPGLLVIPVLEQGTSMPVESELPEDLKSLSVRNAIEIDEINWHKDVGYLVESIARHLNLPVPREVSETPTQSTAASLRVYITYRREDNTGEIARRLADSLYQRMEDIQVTMDVTDIQLKIDPRETIARVIAEHDVILALLGPGWVDVDHIEDRTGLFDPNDSMHQELALALSSNKRVIPLLANGAPNFMSALPEDLEPLGYLQALEINDENWEPALSQLQQALSLPPEDLASQSEFVKPEAFTKAGSSQESVEQSAVESSINTQETLEPDTNRPKVFISYPRAYSNYVKKLNKHLQPYVALSYDEALSIGDDWSSELMRMMDESDAVIAIVGVETAASEYSMQELTSALRQEKLLIPIFVDPFEEPKEIWQFMAANRNSDRNEDIAWLSRLEGSELDRVLKLTAKNIYKSILLQTDM
jgi:hypothetical protein